MSSIPDTFLRPLTTFFGRERERQEIAGYLRDPATRIVALVGVGGIGKTRLALAVAEQERAAFPGGLAFVPLAEAVTAQAMNEAIGSALGVTERGFPSLFEALVATLNRDPGRHLLVLDTVERLDLADDRAAVAEQLVTLCGRCPDLTLLTTSRVAPTISAAQRYPVDILTPPAETTQVSSLERARASAAVNLFVDRWRRVRPGVEIGGANAATLLELCHDPDKLDGHPLAIELAAGLMHHLSLSDLRARFESAPDRLFLGGGGLGGEDRHRSLELTLGWSVDLLPPAGQALLRRLSAFRGGWVVEAATLVGSVDTPPGEPASPSYPADASVVLTTAEIPALLWQLVDCSLARAEPGQAENERFTLLDDVRAVAERQAVATGEHEIARMRHLAWCSSMAAESLGFAETPALVPAWLERVAAEQDNVRAALGFAIERRERETAWRLVRQFQTYWNVYGFLAEGRRWAERSLALGDDPSFWRAGALLAAGIFTLAQGDVLRAERYCAEAATSFEQFGDRENTGVALFNQALAEYSRNDYAQARALLTTALTHFEALDRKQRVAQTKMQLGNCEFESGVLPGAEQYFVEALAGFEETGDLAHQPHALANLGLVHLHTKRLSEAMDAFTQALEIAERLNRFDVLADALRGRAEVYVESRELARAKTDLLRSLELAEAIDDRRRQAAARVNLGATLAEAGEPEEAFEYLREGADLCRVIDERRILSAALVELAAIVPAFGWADLGARLLGCGVALRKATGSQPLPLEADRPRRAETVLRTVLPDATVDAVTSRGAEETPEVLLAELARLTPPTRPRLSDADRREALWLHALKRFAEAERRFGLTPSALDRLAKTTGERHHDLSRAELAVLILLGSDRARLIDLMIEAASQRGVVTYLDAKQEKTIAEIHSELLARRSHVAATAGAIAETPEIAWARQVKPSTIESQLNRIYGQLGGVDREGAAAYARRHGLVTFPWPGVATET